MDSTDANLNAKEKLQKYCVQNDLKDLRALGKLFRRQDKDRSGTLSREEVKNAIALRGLAFTEDEIEEIFKEYDTDKEGTINYEEFLVAMMPEMNKCRTSVVGTAFATLDGSGDGNISRKEMKARFMLLDEQRSKKELTSFFEKLDGGKSGDGLVTKKEFIDYFTEISHLMDNDELFIKMVEKTFGLD